MNRVGVNDTSSLHGNSMMAAPNDCAMPTWSQDLHGTEQDLLLKQKVHQAKYVFTALMLISCVTMKDIPRVAAHIRVIPDP